MNLNKLDKKLNFLIKNKVVFFALMFIIVLALFNYIYNNNYYAVIVFVVSCVVLSYFSKNKLVIMLLSLLLTKLLVHLKLKNEGFKEGKEGKDKEHVHSDNDEHEHIDEEEPDVKPTTEGLSKGSKGTKGSKGLKGASVEPTIDDEETQKSGFANLQENMEDGEQEDLSEAMANIMDSHEVMTKNMKGLAPMMKQAQDLTEKLTKGGFAKLLTKASSYADKLGK